MHLRNLFNKEVRTSRKPHQVVINKDNNGHKDKEVQSDRRNLVKPNRKPVLKVKPRTKAKPKVTTKVKDKHIDRDNNKVRHSVIRKIIKQMGRYLESLKNSNNPMSLRATKDKWQGETGTTEGFCMFDTLTNGTRAGCLNMVHQAKSHNTITKLITAYAPPSENDTEAYIRFVTKFTGYTASENIYVLSKLKDIALAIVHFEGNYADKVDKNLIASVFKKWIPELS